MNSKKTKETTERMFRDGESKDATMIEKAIGKALEKELDGHIQAIMKEAKRCGAETSKEVRHA